MHRLGVITTWLGLILSIVGLSVGFWKMVNGSENAETWISLVPLGFVGLLLGVTLTQMPAAAWRPMRISLLMPQGATEPRTHAAAQPAPSQTASSAERSLDETSIVRPLDSAQAKTAGKPAAVSETPPDSVALQPEDNAASLKPFVMPEFPNASATSSSPEEQIAAALNAWAGAWRARNEDAYFSAYAANFRPEGGQSRAEWEERRRLLLGVSRNIDLQIDGVAAEAITEDRAQVSFRQFYRSDSYRDAVIKQLKFVRVDNRWLIEEENVLSTIKGYQ